MSDYPATKQFFRIINKLKEDIYKIEYECGNADVSEKNYADIINILDIAQTELKRQNLRWMRKQ
jgi:hypothetical protein